MVKRKIVSNNNHKNCSDIVAITRKPMWLKNLKKIFKTRCYTGEEIKKILGVNGIQFNKWFSGKLKGLTGSGETLYLGSEIHKVISMGLEKGKIRVGKNQIYCSNKCKKPTVPEKETLEVVISKFYCSIGNPKIYVSGICSECGKEMRRWSSCNKLEDFLDAFGIKFPSGYSMKKLILTLKERKIQRITIIKLMKIVTNETSLIKENSIDYKLENYLNDTNLYIYKSKSNNNQLVYTSDASNSHILKYPSYSPLSFIFDQ